MALRVDGHLPLPAGFHLALDPSVRRTGPTVVIGGYPIRVLRLSTGAGETLKRWAGGEPIGPAPAFQNLARLLIDSGIAHPRPAPGSGPAPEDVTVVIPVKDDVTGLRRTLDALYCHAGPVIVVDDGSLTSVEARSPTKVIRRDPSGGPAAARNIGSSNARSDIVAFLDAGCEPQPGWLDRLLPHFSDPAVGAVAPRVVHRAGSSLPASLDAYEGARSRLDLGPREAPVRPGSPVSYVPTAALLVRRQALETSGGFDEALRYGEDVDLVWRLVKDGWCVAYEPVSKVTHPGRASFAAWLHQRYGYGRSAASLAERHGRAVAPFAGSPWSAVAWGCALAGRPVAGVGIAAATSIALGRRAWPDRATALALVGLAARGNLLAGLGLARAIRQAWLPPALALLLARPLRARVAVGLTVALVALPLGEWVRRRPAGLGPLTWTSLRLADDLGYQAGVWAGAVEARSAGALLPRWSVRSRS